VQTYGWLRIPEVLFLPPGLSLGLSLLGLWRGWRVLITLGLALLYIAAIPVTSQFLYRHLETYPPLNPQSLPKAQAIVVLGASRYRNAPEYGGDTIAELGLERLRYAAWLARRTNLPILASGGSTLGEPRPESELMGEILSEFGTPPSWLEKTSRNTFENAHNATAILNQHGIDTVLLVTHAWHLPRAVEAFRQAGLNVIPAGTRYTTPSPLEAGPMAFIPTPLTIYRTSLALHEIIGRWWYQIRYYH